MSSILSFLTEDHRNCDQSFAKMEESASSRSSNLPELYGKFHEEMEHHFCLEEKILFPAMVQITGSEAGPIMVMKMEHEQMRNLFGRMEECVKTDTEEFLSLCETLNIMIQQHNIKEEQILYPMAQNLLQNSSSEILARFQEGLCRKD
ncbi:MAG: hemerythrin domain-containing protein [Spirochaetia bacterium]|nr:hemerythrin domain-containing protein [Spirochaetia bacterium]